MKDTNYSQKTNAVDATWTGLIRVGGAAAFLLIGMTIIQATVYFLWPPPSFEPTYDAVTHWFMLLRMDPIVGLLNLDLLMIVDYILNLIIFLGLFLVLKNINRTLMVIALLLGFIGVAVYFPSNPAFGMLTLSNIFTSASQTEQNIIISAGQAIMATFKGTAFVVSYILNAVSGLIMSFVMLKSTFFSRVTAYIGIVFYSMNLIPASAGMIGFYISFLSLLPMLLWLFLIGRKMVFIGKGGRVLD
jgi:hypothetical protein